MTERRFAKRLEQLMLYGGAVFAFSLIGLAWHFGGRQAGRITPVAERKKMPDLALAQLDGGTWRMEEHRGQVVLINYWATWCGPCREEMPGLVRLSRELGPRGLTIVGVSLDEGNKEKVQQFVEEFKVPYPVALSENMSQMAYGMEGVPTTVLVDRHGGVAKTYLGAVGESDFRQDIESLLTEQENTAAP